MELTMTNQSGNRPVTLDKCERASRLSRPGRLACRAILRASARTGQPLCRADLKEVASAAGVEPAAALAELDRADLDRARPHGELLAAYPFSAAPTAHRLILGAGVSVHAMCAIDVLGVSAMLGQPVTVTSAQPDTGRPVTVRVDGDQATWVVRDALHQRHRDPAARIDAAQVQRLLGMVRARLTEARDGT
jgi:Alkylmercury lyase